MSRGNCHARSDRDGPSQRELDDFLSVAAHDLQEPVRGISAYCEALLEDYQEELDQPGQDRLGRLVAVCHRLETMISDLTTYCRAGNARPRATAVDLNLVAGAVLETLAPAIERRGGSVRVAGRLPVVRGDATLISMALRNLITNGLKFNDSPQPRVEIGALPTTPATLYVRDNGIGIDKRHHEAIFTVFRRLHSRRKYEGTGVGLTIVRKIVELHGGRIWLRSEAGRGSNFLFTLGPAKAPSAARIKPRSPHWRQRSPARRKVRAAVSA